MLKVTIFFLCTNKNFAYRFENTFEITPKKKNAEVYSYYFFFVSANKNFAYRLENTSEITHDIH